MYYILEKLKDASNTIPEGALNLRRDENKAQGRYIGKNTVLQGGQEGRDYHCLCRSVKISWRQLFLKWAQDGYDLNKGKDIPGL